MIIVSAQPRIVVRLYACVFVLPSNLELGTESMKCLELTTTTVASNVDHASSLGQRSWKSIELATVIVPRFIKMVGRGSGKKRKQNVHGFLLNALWATVMDGLFQQDVWLSSLRATCVDTSSRS